MDPTDFIARIRDHYVDQFVAFAAQQGSECAQGASEVKLQLHETSKLFQRLYCVDFLKNDGEPELFELMPDRVLTFEPIAGSIDSTALHIDHLCWDDVEIRHDASAPLLDALDGWFERWFDPEDARQDQEQPVSNVIHSLLVQPGSLSIDFGTAEPEAFWEILDLLAASGAETIRVGGSRAEAAAGS